MIRPYVSEDAAATYAVFFAAVRQGAATHYNTEQRAAWASSSDMPSTWLSKLGNATTFVDEDAGEVVGFMSLLSSGCLDMAYVAPDQMGKGIALGLYKAIEKHALMQGLQRLTAEASHLARPFFTRQGWSVEAAQTVKRHGIEIPNFRMNKVL